MSEKLNVYQKLNKIRKAIDGFTKDKASHNYTYVSGSQALAKIKDTMDELGVILEPHLFHEKANYKIFEYDSVDRWGKSKHNIEYIIDMPMEYQWVNIDDPSDRISCPWSLYGQQTDISKALGSGLTYSERYFVLKYFNIPTDELDPDAKEVEAEAPKSSKPNDKTTNNTETKPSNQKGKKVEETKETDTDRLPKAIASIEKLAVELQGSGVDKNDITAAIKEHNVVGDKKIANYNKIKDIEIAEKVYKELMKLKKVEVK